MKRARGFTLIEVIMAMAILSIVISGISVVLIQQSRATVKQTQQRDLEESGRLALIDIARSVRLAGYGLSPLVAFDFDRYACTTPGTVSSCPNGGRDRNDRADEAVLSYRNLTFARKITSIAGNGPWVLSLDKAVGDAFPAGRMLFLICGSASKASYVALNTAAAVGDTSLTVRAAAAGDGPYTLDPLASSGPTDSCFKIGIATADPDGLNAARVYLIERIRYYVANDTDGVPSLFKDRGAGPERLYRGIEDLQFTYEIGAPPVGSPFASGGGTPATAPACGGTTWVYGQCANAETPSTGLAAPRWMDDPYDVGNRYTGNPANIRSVGINLVARATRQSPDGTGDGVPQIGNRPLRASDAYHRAVLNTTVSTPNLLSRAYFVPSTMGGG